MTGVREQVGAPLVSVVMTTYNGDRFVEAQIDSILGQTHRNLELIVSDDGSTDNTMVLLERYKSDPRVRIVTNPNKRGMVSNLEFVLPQARGELIAISDQDDIWRSTKLEKLCEQITGHSAVFCNSEFINENGESLGSTLMEQHASRAVDIGRHFIRLMRANCVSGHALLFRRKLLDHLLPFNPDLFYDHQIALVAALNEGLHYCPEVLVYHRQHGNNQQNRYPVHPSHSEEKQKNKYTRKGRKARREEDMRKIIAFVLARPELQCEKSLPLLWQRFVLTRVAVRLAAANNYLSDLRLFMWLCTINRDFFYLSSSRKAKLFQAFKYVR